MNRSDTLSELVRSASPYTARISVQYSFAEEPGPTPGQRISAALDLRKPHLESGGPAVDQKIVQAYLADALDAAADRRVAVLTRRYHTWFQAMIDLL